MRLIQYTLVLTLLLIGCGVTENNSAPVVTANPNATSEAQSATKVDEPKKTDQPIRSKADIKPPNSHGIDLNKNVGEPIDLANPPKGTIQNNDVPKKKKSN